MSQNFQLKCVWCNNTYYTRQRRSLYCSDAHRQAAYRQRVKVHGKAKDSTITMDEQVIYNAIREADPEIGEVLDGFFIRGEIKFLKDLLNVFKRFDLNCVLWEYGLFDKFDEVELIVRAKSS